MEPGVLHKIDTIPKGVEVISPIVDTYMIELSFMYAREYQKDGQFFIRCFIKFAGLRTACAFVVQSYKRGGIFRECQESGKDLSGYSAKLPIEEKWKRVLAEMLLIIYSIIKSS